MPHPGAAVQSRSGPSSNSEEDRPGNGRAPGPGTQENQAREWRRTGPGTEAENQARERPKSGRFPIDPLHHAGAVRLATMDLEEKSLDHISDRCEECGAKLTPAEIEAAMESGGPALCTVHADEVVPVGEEDDAFGEE
jgi:hypothetical protein